MEPQPFHEFYIPGRPRKKRKHWKNIKNFMNSVVIDAFPKAKTVKNTTDFQKNPKKKSEISKNHLSAKKPSNHS